MRINPQNNHHITQLAYLNDMSISTQAFPTTTVWMGNPPVFETLYNSISHIILTKVAFIVGIIALTFIISTTAIAQKPTIFDYDFGQVDIVQDQFATDSRFYNMPVAMRGVVGIPDSEGPFPVLLFIHGSYPFCTAAGTGDADAYPCPDESFIPQYEGFTYLAEALAEQGYITIIPDLSAEFNNGFGEPIMGARSNQIIAEHLSRLASTDGESPFGTAQADLSQLYIVTHSRGGPLALLFMNSEEGAMYPATALTMITPAIAAPDYTVPESLPTALIMAECDGDVGLDQPMFYLDNQLAQPRPTLTTIYSVPQGTHNAFSTMLDSDPNSPCDESEWLDADLQRDFILQFLPDFFDMATMYGHIGN